MKLRGWRVNRAEVALAVEVDVLAVMVAFAVAVLLEVVLAAVVWRGCCEGTVRVWRGCGEGVVRVL